MKFMTKIVLLATLLHAAPLQAESPSVLDRIFRYFRPQVEESIHFVRVSDGAMLFGKNQARTLSPASVSKLVTAAAALDKLGPTWKFKTKVFYSGQLKDGVIHGNLYVKGDGDPFLINEKIWQFAVDLRHRGVRRVTGNLVIDNSLFGGETRDASRQSGKQASQNSYDAPVSAFGVNFNTYSVAVMPGESIGKEARIGLDPYPSSSVTMINRLRTVSATQSNAKVNASRVTNEQGSTIMLSGDVRADAELSKIYRSVGDALEASGQQFLATLQAEGMALDGKIVGGMVPVDAHELATINSYGMERIISGLNKWSNNYIADMLVKRMGAEFPARGPARAAGSGTLENGVHVMNSFLRDNVGIRDGYVLLNGSGLSTENRLSAQQITQLLTYMARRLDLFPEFLVSLPAAGWDGTLRDRFDKETAEAVKGQVRAKTGTLTSPVSVSSLAGYLQHPEHGLVAFAIIENGQRGKNQPNILDLRARQDHALTEFMTQATKVVAQ